MTKSDYLDPTDDWTVPKLIGIIVSVLGFAFTLIWVMSP